MLSYERGRGGGDNGTPTQAASELARLRTETTSQAAELVKLRDERTGLMLKLHEQQKRIEELKDALDRASLPPPPPPPPLPPAANGLIADLAQRSASGIRRGAGVREAALDAPAAAVAVAPVPWTESQPPLVLDGSGGAPSPRTAPPPPVTIAGGPSATPTTDLAQPTSTESSLAAVREASADLTATLLQKQEQLRQQEELLLALKQQQGQARALTQQAQSQVQTQQRQQALQQQIQQQQALQQHQQQQVLLQQQQQLLQQQQQGGTYSSSAYSPSPWGPVGAGGVRAAATLPFSPSSHLASSATGLHSNSAPLPPPPIPARASSDFGALQQQQPMRFMPPPPPVASQSLRFAQAQAQQQHTMPWVAALASSGHSSSVPPGAFHPHHPYASSQNPPQFDGGYPTQGTPVASPTSTYPGHGYSQAVSTLPAGTEPVNPQAMLPPHSPLSGQKVTQKEVKEPPPGVGWTIFNHPPKGTRWPDNMPFFQPLVDVGIPFIKHGESSTKCTQYLAGVVLCVARAL